METEKFKDIKYETRYSNKLYETPGNIKDNKSLAWTSVGYEE